VETDASFEMMLDTFHAGLPETAEVQRHKGEEMPCRSADRQSIAEIRISDCHRMRIRQFPIGAVKHDSVVGIHGLWSSSAGNETLQ